MAHHLQLTHKSASSLSALLLASTFSLELHVPFAEQIKAFGWIARKARQLIFRLGKKPVIH